MNIVTILIYNHSLNLADTMAMKVVGENGENRHKKYTSLRKLIQSTTLIRVAYRSQVVLFCQSRRCCRPMAAIQANQQPTFPHYSVVGRATSYT